MEYVQTYSTIIRMKRAKLTLTIDPRVVEEAKRKASEQHTTVSAMVETFLRQATTGSQATSIRATLRVPGTGQRLR